MTAGPVAGGELAELRIEALRAPVAAADLEDLCSLLIDAVESGAAVSFLAPLERAVARDWWLATVAALGERALLLVARDARGIVGAVQLHPAWAPNQPHRADIAKLLVHRRARRQGLGTRLMQAVQERARAAGLTLLTLDAKRGAVVEELYQRLGWVRVGAIPHYALDTDGVTPHDTVVYYKTLPPAAAR